MLLAPPARATAEQAAAPAAVPGASAPWECWNRLRVLCEAHVALGAVLELGPDLPEDDAEIERWCGEPLRAVLLPTAIFMTNKKGGARSC